MEDPCWETKGGGRDGDMGSCRDLEISCNQQRCFMPRLEPRSNPAMPQWSWGSTAPSIPLHPRATGCYWLHFRTCQGKKGGSEAEV